MAKKVVEAEPIAEELLDLGLFLTGPEIQELSETAPAAVAQHHANARPGAGAAAAIRDEAQQRALSGAAPLPGRQASADQATEMGMRGAAAAMAVPGAAEFMSDMMNMAPDANEISDAEARRRSRLPSTPNRFALAPDAGLDHARISGPDRRRLAAPSAPNMPGTALSPARPSQGNRPRHGGNDLVANTFRSALAELGAPAFDPNWLAVRQLPAYQVSQIRTLGRNVFASLGCTVPIEDIQMISTLTHQQAEVQQLASAIVHNGEHLRSESMVFGGVACQVQLWRFANHDWAVTQDAGGHYVYGWPENFLINPAPGLSNTNSLQDGSNYLDAPPRRLR